GPFPSLGMTGAAVSLVTSYSLRAAALAGYVLARRAAVALPPGLPRLRGALFRDILRVGLPGPINTVLTNLNVVAVTGPVGAFGLGLALYFAAQGAGRLIWPLVAGFGRFLVPVGGGWLAVSWLGGELPALFAAIALAFVVFGGAQAAAVNTTIRRR